MARVTPADMARSNAAATVAHLLDTRDPDTGRYRTRYAEVQYVGGTEDLYLLGVPVTHDEVIEWLRKAKGFQGQRCLLCHLGIPDIHLATKAARLKFGR